jgi:hypothetical protein
MKKGQDVFPKKSTNGMVVNVAFVEKLSMNGLWARPMMCHSKNMSKISNVNDAERYVAAYMKMIIWEV